MSDSSTPGPWRGPTMTLRVDRPDGSITETVRHDDGRITIVRVGRDGEIVARFAIDLHESGAVTVTESTAGHAPRPIDPSSRESMVNPFGSELETVEYDGLLSVTNTYTDDGDLRTVSMRGEWGEQDVELRSDGARTMTWACPLQHGTANWNAAGQLDHHKVTYSDQTIYQWHLTSGVGRETVVDWDGTDTVRRGAESRLGDRYPTDEQAR